MSDVFQKNNQKLADSLIEIYEMVYNVVARQAEIMNLQMPYCVEPEEVRDFDFENIFFLQELIDSFQTMLTFVQESGMVTSETQQKADKYLQEHKDEKDNPVIGMVDKFMSLAQELKKAIENKELESEYLEALQASEAAISAILEHRKMIEMFALKIEQGGFPVDARKLVRNYLSACRRDPDEAYKLLTTNPAYFSPLILKGKTSLWRKITGKGPKMPSPDVGQKINRELARFLKNLKL